MRKTGILVASCLFTANVLGIDLSMDSDLLANAESKAMEISLEHENINVYNGTALEKVNPSGRLCGMISTFNETPDQKAKRQFGYTSKNLVTFYFATERRSYTPIFDLTRSAVRKSQWRTLSGMLN